MPEEQKIIFTKKMKKNYTILIPNMLPTHFKLIAGVFENEGYKIEILQNEGKQVVETGLRYVHNDTCYPALLVIGQMIDALNSGKFDINKVALMITQTGGGCRASNYINLLRKALKKAGYTHIPVISLNASGLEKNPGFTLNLSLLRKLLAVVAYGDLLMLLKNQTKPYETTKGDCKKLIELWQRNLCNQLKKGNGLSLKEMKKNFRLIVSDFVNVKVQKRKKVKVGIVGEIYIKFASLGNNNLEKFLEEQNCEYMVPGLMGFLLYCVENNLQDISLYGGSKLKYFFIKKILHFLENIEKELIAAVEKPNIYLTPANFETLKNFTDGIIGLGNKMGEGWLLPAEMMELCDKGYTNIISAQPFGCLPNHIVAKGMIHPIKKRYPNANITAIDYDPGASKVNQENRIKLMLAIAREKKDIQ